MTRRRTTALAALLTIGAGAGIAHATIPGPDGTILLCYASSPGGVNGPVRPVDSATDCNSAQGEHVLPINQRGPSGPAGPQGPTGSQGPAGTAAPVPEAEDILVASDGDGGQARTLAVNPAGAFENPTPGPPLVLDKPIGPGTYRWNARADLRIAASGYTTLVRCTTRLLAQPAATPGGPAPAIPSAGGGTVLDDRRVEAATQSTQSVIFPDGTLQTDRAAILRLQCGYDPASPYFGLVSVSTMRLLTQRLGGLEIARPAVHRTSLPVPSRPGTRLVSTTPLRRQAQRDAATANADPATLKRAGLVCPHRFPRC